MAETTWPGNILSIINKVFYALMTIQRWTNIPFESTGHLTCMYDNQLCPGLTQDVKFFFFL